MVKIELELTEREALSLQAEMDGILRSYRRSYNGQRYDNSDMGNAFNKVYKALLNKDHHRWTQVQDEENRRI